MSFLPEVEALRKALREELGSEALRSVPKYVALTFDDGIAGTQYSTVTRLLSKYRIPLTLFPQTDPTGRQVREVYREPAMAEPEHREKIREIHRMGAEIGSHSVTHRDLTKLSEEEVDSELAQSRASLEELVGGPVRSFAYPYGAYTPQVVRAVRRYYDQARSVGAYEMDSKIPVRPHNRFTLAPAPLSSLHLPLLPTILLYHNEDLDRVEADLKPLFAEGVEFLTFWDFARKVSRFPHLGVEVIFPLTMAGLTSRRKLLLGVFPGEVEVTVVAQSPETRVGVYTASPEAQDLGTILTGEEVVKEPSISQIRELGSDIWEVERWSSPLFTLRLRRPLPGAGGLSVVVDPAQGTKASVKALIRVRL
jgi:peptidoglycan/xylan/chitin deacetylase (PgdA/CDA1 family)